MAALKLLGRNNYYRLEENPKIPDNIFESETGRYLLIYDSLNKPKNLQEISQSLKVFNDPKATGIRENNKVLTDILENKNRYIDSIGVALAKIEPHDLRRVNNSPNSFKIVPEKIIQKQVSLTQPPLTDDYLEKEKNCSWGIHKLQVLLSDYDGKGVTIGILDTGIDINHPDFIRHYPNRKIEADYIIGKSPQDRDGHGTHCIGIASGFKDANGVRYGVASKSNIYAVKVLNKHGKGKQWSVLKGMDKAIDYGCNVISMSLGTQHNSKDNYDIAYERMVKKADDNNCIIVTAAGNDSDRPKTKNAIGYPASGNTIITVNAINNNFMIYELANQAKYRYDQDIDFVAPGVQVYSAWSRTGKPKKANHVMTGTSMATPFVAGLVALLKQKFPYATNSQIKQSLFNLTDEEQRKKLDVWDYGQGLPIWKN